MLKQKGISLDIQESLSLEAASSLVLTLNDQLGPFNAITSQTRPWEQRSMAASLAQKLQKAKRNKHWKRRRRRHVTELLCKEREGYGKADQEADDWRTREIAKDIAKRKVESMEAIAAVGGHFLPEEDKFLERVRASVEEEHQAAAAADTDTAKDAIATAEVSRKTVIEAEEQMMST